MQLKTVGESLNALNTINDVLKPISHLEDIPEELYKVTNKELYASLSGYSADAVKAAIAQSTLNEEQIKGILKSKDYKGQLLETTTAELAQATNLNRIAKSEDNALNSTQKFSYAMSGLGDTIKKFVSAHPIMTAVVAVTAAFHVIGKITDSFVETADEVSGKLQKNIDKSTSSYNDIASKLENINSELEENKQRIDELNMKDKLTYVETQELNKLKSVNQYLERQQEILKEAKLAAAQESADDIYEKFSTDFYTNKTKTYKDLKNQDNKFTQVTLGIAEHIPVFGKKLVDGVTSESYDTDSDILNNAIKNYKKYKSELDTLINSGKNYTQGEYDALQKQIDKYSKTINSYKTTAALTLNDLLAVDPNLETDASSKLLDFLDHIEVVTNTDDFANNIVNTLKESDDFYQAGQEIQKKIKEGLLSEENLLSDKDASKYVNEVAKQLFEAQNDIKLEDGATFKASIENTIKRLEQDFNDAANNNDMKSAISLYAELEFLKKAAETSYDNLFKRAGSYITENISKDIQSLKSFEEVWNSSDFNDSKNKLSDLARAGTISAETIKSTEDYQSLLDKTGLTAGQAAEKIKNLLSVQERLSMASEGISALQTAYKEFSDEAVGFVTASTLEALPDVFKSLKTYDFNLFEEIVGNPKNGTDKIQQAFNDIATAYITEQGILNGLIHASESELDSYIANLKTMGITNAEEVVNNARKSLSDNNKLLIEAQEEYSKYLANKDGYNTQYIQSVNSKNSQLISKLGSAYQQDYDNWKELITKKSNAYNQFVSAVNVSQNVDKAMLSVPGAGDEAPARKIVNESNGKIPRDKSIINTTPGVNVSGINSIRNIAGNVSAYTSAEIKAAQEYLDAIEQYNTLNDTFKLHLSEISVDFGSPDFNLDKSLSEYNEAAENTAESTADAMEKSEETFDWIARRIQNLTDALNDLKDASDDTYSTWSDRSNALVNAINTARQAIDLQQQAYNRYMKEAESVGLPEVYKNLIQNGAIDISVISDDDLKEKINQYQEWYDKAKDCLDTQNDLTDSLNELNSKEFDNIQSIFDFDKEKLQHSLTMLNNQIDRLEMKGLFANESYYNQMLNYTQKEISTLAKERSRLADVLNSGGLSQDSEAWQNMYSTLLKIDEEMDDLNKDLIEFNNNIRNLNYEIFEYLEDSISRITDETDYFINLLEDKKLFDDNGNFNKYADAAVALHAAAFDTYRQQAQDYLEEMQDLQRQLVAGAGKDVLEQYNKMVDAHQEAVLAADNEKKAIFDLIEDGYNAQLEAIRKVIDKKKEQMNMEKNLYDYQKSISKKTKNIASLEKQTVSLADDDSEETMTRIQQLKVQLEEARADLKETEYEQYLSDTQNMLDCLVTDYESWMNSRLDNEDALLSEIVGKISTEGSAIKATLHQVAGESGTTISTSLNTIFSTTSPFTTILTDSITGVKNAVAGTTAAINNLLNKVANVTGTSVSGTNAGTSTKPKNTATKAGSSANASVTVSGTTSGNAYGTNTSGNSTANSSGNNSNSLSGSNVNATGTAGSNAASASNGLIAGIFISKADSYPKSKLDKEHSIVDRLKYFNFDSSFSARGQYYTKLGGSGTYTGSAGQNTWLLGRMKLKGYKNGTSHVPKKDNYLIQEAGQELIYDKSEGAFVIPQTAEPTIVPLNVGDMVFRNESVKRLFELATDPNFNALKNNPAPTVNPFIENIKKATDVLQTTNTMNTINEIHMEGDINLALPNVSNYKEFRSELIKDDTFEKAIFTMVNNGIMGKSTIEKRKYAR